MGDNSGRSSESIFGQVRVKAWKDAWGQASQVYSDDVLAAEERGFSRGVYVGQRRNKWLIGSLAALFFATGFLTAQAIEAGTAKTEGLGAQYESAGRKAAP